MGLQQTQCVSRCISFFGWILYPTNQSRYNASKAASKAIIQSFAYSSSPPGFVQFSGTSEVVQDYHAIRQALGYNKIVLLGLLYEIYRAARYAATFPARAGNFVLDAVVPHGFGLFEQANDETTMVNRALLRADAFCQISATCPIKELARGAVHKVCSNKSVNDSAGCFLRFITKSLPLPITLHHLHSLSCLG